MEIHPIRIGALLLLMVIPLLIDAQVVDRTKQRTKNRAEENVAREAEQGVDKAFNSIKGLFKKKDKKNKKKNQESDPNAADGNSDSVQDNGGADTEDIELWSVRYDFKPGAEIIYFDDFEAEEVGEIPSKWKFIKGEIETVKTNTDQSKALRWTSKTAPNFEDSFELPERFTLEFDVYLKGPPYNASYNYYVNFTDVSTRKTTLSMSLGMGSISARGYQDGAIPETTKEDFYNSWHHISVSYNRGSLKAYFDQYRLINVRIEGPFQKFHFNNCCTTRDSETLFMIDNVRIAEGAHPKYDEEIIKGKIVTHNILFEVDSDRIIPRSYAEVKRIADLMQANPSVKFRVVGHTDSDGSDDYNLTLSQKRAAAVVQALTEMGIQANRLTSEGAGESEPLQSNDTPEGKAMNRRVEFVKV